MFTSTNNNRPDNADNAEGTNFVDNALKQGTIFVDNVLKHVFTYVLKPGQNQRNKMSCDDHVKKALRGLSSGTYKLPVLQVPLLC